ncbi:microsomal glutathione S-transferase 1-like [Neocloeon triangulifer]|uniref:microsomal glutathione S-transferase 1-like n=1 Tax=Neocloeon triangulifer TaxID=2078957 RepID=UPI00286F89D8|nr:microsomal glutathione S-transferase 1-like [Neocloeon triangulifer]
MEVLSKQNPLFTLYSCHAALLVCKIIFVGFSTSMVRVFKKVTPNPEDAKFMGTKPFIGDPTIERIRRAHRNDLENIPAFLFVSFLYVLTNPSYVVAKILFWSFTIARYSHTLVYAYLPIPQPARALSFAVGLIATFIMAIQVLFYFY